MSSARALDLLVTESFRQVLSGGGRMSPDGVTTDSHCSRMSNKSIIIVMLLATLVYAALVIGHSPVFERVPGYVWLFMKYVDTSLPCWWLLLPLLGLAALFIGYVLKHPAAVWRNLLLLVLLGYAVQLGFGLSEGRGLDAIGDRLINTGHAEFARIAVSEVDASAVLTGYEQWLAADDSLQFPRAKPPGQMLFYLATARLAQALSPSADPEIRLRRLATFAAWVWPLLCYLVLIPLYFLGRNWLDTRSAYWPCILYLFLPSVTLVTLHLDQVIYPLMFILNLAVVVTACRRSINLALLAGTITYLSLYFSFSLLPLLPLAPALAVICVLNWTKRSKRLVHLVKFLIGYLAGTVLLYVIFLLLLNYDPLLRYREAMAFHEAWKSWQPGIGSTVKYALLNYIEFACWLGLPLAVLYLSNAGHAISRIGKKKLEPITLFAAALVLIFLGVGFLGRTQGEVGRLWIFLMPLVCLFAAVEILRRFTRKPERIMILVMALQFVTILIIKRYQDFW